MRCADWNIAGARGEMIHGTTHFPDGDAVGVLLLGHGFLGYKDYGMFPWLAEQLAKLGWIAHRFNFSHSGMLEGKEAFVRPDLFEQATWNTQVEDIEILCTHFKEENVPNILFGHSRGGLAALLAMGRGGIDVDGVISLSAPSECNSLTDTISVEMRSVGYIERASSRTNQTLRIGRVFLDEQLADPDGHDLLRAVASIQTKVLIIRGEDDPTVPIDCAEQICAHAQCPTFARIQGGDHILNTPNPFPLDGSPSPQLKSAMYAMQQFLQNFVSKP
jgi:pimeloyl-ACP methyl ester carboxylesterase